MRYLLAAALLLAPAATLARSDAPDVALAKALKGMHPAGKPQSCVSLRDVPDTRTIDENTIVFRAGASRAYVNHPPGGCPLNANRAFSSRTPTDQLCSGDIIRVFDPVSHIEFGSCTLGAFEPYRR